MKIDGTDLGTTLELRAKEMVAFAHDPDHYLRPLLGQSPDRTYPAFMVYRLKLPNWETAVKFSYSVDVREGRGVRHLSVQVSVPGFLTQGEVTSSAPALLELLDAPVRMFFPLVDDLRYHVTALAPVPIVDARVAAKDRNVHYRTPVAFHFLVDHGVVDEEEAAAMPPARVAAVRRIHAALAQASLATTDPEERDAVHSVSRDLVERYSAAFVSLGDN